MSPLAMLLLAATPDCSAAGGWQAGRGGRAADAACEAPDYREAHRLGEALHALLKERRALATQLPQAAPAAQGPLRRRQRQLDTDLEALRGLATLRGWPLDPLPEPPP